MQSKQISPTLTAAIIALVALVVLGGGYFLFLRPHDPEGISDAKLTPQQAAELRTGGKRGMDEYLRTRNGGGQSAK